MAAFPSAAAFSALLQISDSALPTGAFSHSFGMEQYLSRGVVDDADSCERWLRAYLRTQLTYSDALIIRLAYADLDATRPLDELSELVAAVTIPEQVRTAGAAMAKRLRAIGRDSLGVPEPKPAPVHPALEFAWIAYTFAIDVEAAVHAHLSTAVTSLVQNAVRGIPIGQSAGQALVARAHPEIERALAVSATLDRDDLGAVAPGLEIAQMQHARLRARMFMS